MKEKYVDQYGNDSLIHLRIASQKGCEIFISKNKALLKDKKELEAIFNIKIREPNEMTINKILNLFNKHNGTE